MNQPIVIIGIGELGGVFAGAFLHAGYPVYPVTRQMDIDQAAKMMPDPQLVLVAVAEKDFPPVMQTLPAPWRNRIGLLQNELLPRDWQSYRIDDPTVISVWFEKKKGMDTNELIPSRVYGPQAKLIAGALHGIDIACEVLSTEEDLLYELVRKNVFVFTINIAGLVLAEGTDTATLWAQHHELALAIADERGSEVSLSYRSESFSRAKAKNRDRIEQYSREGKIKLYLPSNLIRIDESEVTLDHQGKKLKVANDAVIINAGGILPSGFLKQIGIQVDTKFGTA